MSAIEILEAVRTEVQDETLQPCFIPHTFYDDGTDDNPELALRFWLVDHCDTAHPGSC